MGMYDETPDQKLTFNQLSELEQSDAPDDVDRAQRLNDEWRAGLTAPIADSIMGDLGKPFLGDSIIGKLGEGIIGDGLIGRTFVPDTLGKIAGGGLLDIAKTSMVDAKLTGAIAGMSKYDSLTEGLMPKFDFGKAVTATVGLDKLAGASAMAAEAFTMPKLAWQDSFTGSMRRDQDALNESMAELARVSQEREDHKYEAEQAAIDTRRLLDALVDVANAQQAQQATQAQMLTKMATQTAELTATIKAQGEQDDRRWWRTWPAQVIEVLLALVAAVFAVLAWQATKNQPAPIVNMPAPVVVQAPQSTVPTPPVEPSAAEAPPSEQPQG